MLSRNNIIIIGIALLTVTVIGGGLWAYDSVQGDTLAPSGPITAIPLAANTVAPTLDAPGQVSQPEPTEVRPTSEGSATVEPTNAATSTTQVSGPAIFQISQGQSEVRFSIYEELAGEPQTVVGATSQVAGEVAVDLADLSKVQAGVIQINARTFVTDSERRNRAIRNFILQTDQYEFITSTPKQIIGLSGSAQPGQLFTFQIAGDLTIRDITQPVVFTLTVQGESAARLTGTATTVVTRSDYNLVIPSVPNVANVGEEVTLEIDFVAETASN